MLCRPKIESQLDVVKPTVAPAAKAAAKKAAAQANSEGMESMTRATRDDRFKHLYTWLE